MNKFFTKALAGAAAITILTSAAAFAAGVNGPLNTVYENIDNVIMVPLRSNAEGLGYNVEWDGETNTVFISSGAQFATFTIGEDAYTVAKTAPMSLGSAPILFGGDTTYVPLTFFTELLNINARPEDNGYVLTVPNLVTLTSIEEDGSLSVQDENFGEVIVRIDENTEITADGKPAERDMLAAGQLLDIEYNGIMTRSIPPQTTAVRIDIQNMPETVEYHDAKILSVDTEHKSITVSDENFDEIIVSVTEETSVTKGTAPAGFADLAEGQEIVVSYADYMTASIPPQTKAVTISINEEAPSEAEFRNAIISVVDEKSITVNDDVSGEVVAHLTDETLIKRENGEGADVSDLKEGAKIRIRYANHMTMSLPPQTNAVEIIIL